MLHEIMQFVIRHWALCAAFLVVSLLLVVEEIRSQRVAGGKVSSAQATHLINRENALIIDLRDAAAFREGHIIGAKNMPLSEFDRHQEKLQTHRDRAIILVDGMGIKTAGISTQLIKAGFHHVTTLKGGMESWKADNMPVIKSK